MAITLEYFQQPDFAQLASEIENPKFALQWAGPKYQFPLSWNQLQAKIELEESSHKIHYLFKAKAPSTGQTVGFAEIAIKNIELKIGLIGSVLIYKAFRGQKKGTALMKAVTDFGFQTLGMNELVLNVFDFNTAAIACYEKLGFKKTKFNFEVIAVENEKWSSVSMSLLKMNPLEE